MTPLSSSAMLAPFQVRSFRFQWPADLLTSWGIEMENLVLGWYIRAHVRKINRLDDYPVLYTSR
jgi:hypothetical protein